MRALPRPSAASPSPAPAFADDPTFEIAIRDHRFMPNEITVPGRAEGQADRQERGDATPEEFESKKLNREKVIPGRSQATIFIGPLKPGEYPFIGEFNEEHRDRQDRREVNRKRRGRIAPLDRRLHHVF